jgi:hypothetical protein
MGAGKMRIYQIEQMVYNDDGGQDYETFAYVDTKQSAKNWIHYNDPEHCSEWLITEIRVESWEGPGVEKA